MPYDTHHCVHRPALVVSLQGTPQSFQGIENGRRISVQDIELQISWRKKKIQLMQMYDSISRENGQKLDFLVCELENLIRTVILKGTRLFTNLFSTIS